MRVTVGTRGSPLALKQTNLVLALLRQGHPTVEFVTKTVQTQGDLRLDVPLKELPRGLFAKELETALMDGEIDMAVHSYKDLPTELAPGLAIAAIGEREDPRDVLVSPNRKVLRDLDAGSRLGTSSPRRLAQIKAFRPDLQIMSIRGNVGTRIQKAREGSVEGVVLAAAGLRRLGLWDQVTEVLEPELCVPAVGQGALAVQVRANDRNSAEIARAVNHQESFIAITAESAVLHRLGGGCRTPIAAYARLEGDSIRINGMVASFDGERMVRTSLTHPSSRPEEAGARLAERLLDLGAGPLLEEEEP
ncbi:MAG: hemC [Dehalococcoidia bacterium]|nr:hemC [Dehalococcoidia bacterium]